MYKKKKKTIISKNKDWKQQVIVYVYKNKYDKRANDYDIKKRES